MLANEFSSAKPMAIPTSATNHPPSFIQGKVQDQNMIDSCLAPSVNRSTNRQDANTPFFFQSFLEATSHMETCIPDKTKAPPMPTPLMTAADSFSSLDSISYPGPFDACSSMAADSRPQTMASTFNDMIYLTSNMDPVYLTRRNSLDRFGPSSSSSNPLPFAHSNSLDTASAAFSHGVGFGLNAKQAQPPRFTTDPQVRPSNLANDATERGPWQQSHPCSSISPTSFGVHSHVLDQAETPVDTANVLPRDGLAVWLAQDILSELADEVKADQLAPSAAVEQQPGEMKASHSPCSDISYRPRRNAVAQLPPLVSSSLTGSMLRATDKSETDTSSMSSSKWDEESSELDADSMSVHRAWSPHSCPLSPSTKPFASRARTATMRETNQLPHLHGILSSWNFNCDRGRYRKPTKAGRKSVKGNKARQLKAQQTKQETNDASCSLTARGPGRSRKNTVASKDLDMGVDESDAAHSDTLNVFEHDSEGTQEDPAKRTIGASKSCGNTFSLTDRIILRPRGAGCDEDEVAYPKYAPHHQEARLNSGSDLSLAGQDVVDETQVTFSSDLYAPRFTRRGPYGREGCCSMCTQGEWYSMKRSQYLYHLQYDHGICSLTRKTFEPPVHMRFWNDPMQRTEGLCHHCLEWIPLCFGAVRKRDYKAWFKHAQKCYRHKA